MTVNQEVMVCTAALLLGSAGAFAGPAGAVQSASDGTAGEAAAHAYYAQNGAQFASQSHAITSAQTLAALAEGELEGSRANQLHMVSDGGVRTLPVQVPPLEKGAEQIQVPEVSASGEGNWILPARGLAQFDEQ
jgi:hypothetical protein